MEVVHSVAGDVTNAVQFCLSRERYWLRTPKICAASRTKLAPFQVTNKGSSSPFLQAITNGGPLPLFYFILSLILNVPSLRSAGHIHHPDGYMRPAQSFCVCITM